MQNKKTIKAGIIGSGFAASFHYAALQRVFSAAVEVVGVYSIAMDEAEDFATSRGIKRYATLQEIMADVDIIHVCVPPAYHEEIVLSALKADKDVIVEKPFTGYFGNQDDRFNGDTFPREQALVYAIDSVKRMLQAEAESKGRIMYAENWIYAPAVQKEREIIEKSKSQILWISGEQSHSGSHSLSYGKWKLSGGGSLIGKGCHPLTAVFYLKAVEGYARLGRPIRPKTVSARVHALTRMDSYDNKGYLKTHYSDIEDFATLHLVFEDGTVADIFANELSLGGTNNWLKIYANNHRTECNMSHNNSMQTYTPEEKNFEDVYIVEKTETKQGWSQVSPDEGWFLGYQHEMNAFYNAHIENGRIESNSQLAADTIITIYTAYLSAEKKGAELEICLVSD